MAIVVNGVNIPNAGDYIKAGSTNIDKVNVVKNSVTTTVWNKVTDVSVFTPGSGINPGFPYTIYNGNRTRECNRDGNSLHYDTLDGGITVNSSYIDMKSSHTFYGGAKHNGVSTTEYIQFSYDLTPFKSISATVNIYSNVSTDNVHKKVFYIQILNPSLSSVAVSQKVGDSGSRPWGGDAKTYSHSETVTLNVSSLSGVHYIRFNDEITAYCGSDGGNGDGYVRITSIKFNS